MPLCEGSRSTWLSWPHSDVLGGGDTVNAVKAATALAVSRADVDRALRTGDLLAEIEAIRQAKSHVGRPPAHKVKVDLDDADRWSAG